MPGMQKVAQRKRRSSSLPRIRTPLVPDTSRAIPPCLAIHRFMVFTSENTVVLER